MGWRPQQPEEFGAVKVGAVSAVKDNGLLAKQYATRRSWARMEGMDARLSFWFSF